MRGSSNSPPPPTRPVSTFSPPEHGASSMGVRGGLRVGGGGSSSGSVSSSGSGQQSRGNRLSKVFNVLSRGSRSPHTIGGGYPSFRQKHEDQWGGRPVAPGSGGVPVPRRWLPRAASQEDILPSSPSLAVSANANANASTGTSPRPAQLQQLQGQKKQKSWSPKGSVGGGEVLRGLSVGSGVRDVKQSPRHRASSTSAPTLPQKESNHTGKGDRMAEDSGRVESAGGREQPEPAGSLVPEGVLPLDETGAEDVG
ncbi:unnamed protein product, partial [Discosporangium mesarthrocarpum]